jgi:hypothetical protein
MLAYAYRRVSAEDLQGIVRRLLPKTDKLISNILGNWQASGRFLGNIQFY